MFKWEIACVKCAEECFQKLLTGCCALDNSGDSLTRFFFARKSNLLAKPEKLATRLSARSNLLFTHRFFHFLHAAFLTPSICCVNFTTFVKLQFFENFWWISLIHSQFSTIRLVTILSSLVTFFRSLSNNNFLCLPNLQLPQINLMTFSRSLSMELSFIFLYSKSRNEGLNSEYN